MDKAVIVKDCANFLWLNSLDQIGYFNLKVTTQISSLDISDDILGRKFLDCTNLGRLMNSTPLFAKKILSLFIVLLCLQVCSLFIFISAWSINADTNEDRESLV